MARQRRTDSAAFQGWVALAVVKGDSTANELAAQHQIQPTLVSNWKQALLQGAEALFAEGARAARPTDQPDPAELFELIGRLTMKLDWLKKPGRHA